MTIGKLKKKELKVSSITASVTALFYFVGSSNQYTRYISNTYYVTGKLLYYTLIKKMTIKNIRKRRGTFLKYLYVSEF